MDFSCFWILFGYFSKETFGNERALGFIVYNFIAFGLQMFIGDYCDKNRKFPSAAVGCVLVFAAVLLSGISPVSALFVTALGNAFFHIGGGIDSLVNSGGKLSRGGVFVSAGALGVVYGTLEGTKIGISDYNPVLLIKPAALMLACAVLCYFAHRKCIASGETKIKGAANPKAEITLVIIFALVSVVIRSFGGSLIPMEWKTGAQMGLIAGYAAFFGKFIGGFAADFFGAKTTGTASLLLSLPLLIFGKENVMLSAVGIILFNMTMPITLGIIAEKMPKNPGAAFGLTTAALLLGAVPSFFAALGGSVGLLIPAVIISAICIYVAADNKKSLSEV